MCNQLSSMCIKQCMVCYYFFYIMSEHTEEIWLVLLTKEGICESKNLMLFFPAVTVPLASAKQFFETKKVDEIGKLIELVAASNLAMTLTGQIVLSSVISISHPERIIFHHCMFIPFKG